MILIISSALRQICVRPDAQKKTNGLSPVPQDIIKLVLIDPDYWPRLTQLIKTCKPIVDAIGNLESHDATLADCMLELIWCARQMFHIELEDGENIGFWMHAKSVFNREFHAMNTNIHSLTLFLHPMCRKLAVSQAAKSRTFEQMCQAALDIARQWCWNGEQAGRLMEDLKQYYQCKGSFAGSQANGKEWWESLPILAKDHPLKTMAITLLSIVPHSAEVEQLFSDLGSIQGVK